MKLEWKAASIRHRAKCGDYTALINHDSEWYVMRAEHTSQPNAPVLGGSSESLEDAQRCCEILIDALERIDRLGGAPGWRLY